MTVMELLSAAGIKSNQAQCHVTQETEASGCDTERYYSLVLFLQKLHRAASTPEKNTFYIH